MATNGAPVCRGGSAPFEPFSMRRCDRADDGGWSTSDGAAWLASGACCIALLVLTHNISALMFMPLLALRIAGLAIDLSRTWLHATHGYQIVWVVCGVPILAAIPLVYRLMRVEAAQPATRNPNSPRTSSM